MPFKEEVTKNIYSDWYDKALSFYDNSGFRPLGDFNLEELEHLKWLIEEQMKVLHTMNPKQEI